MVDNEQLKKRSSNMEHMSYGAEDLKSLKSSKDDKTGSIADKKKLKVLKQALKDERAQKQQLSDEI